MQLCSILRKNVIDQDYLTTIFVELLAIVVDTFGWNVRDLFVTLARHLNCCTVVGGGLKTFPCATTARHDLVIWYPQAFSSGSRYLGECAVGCPLVLIKQTYEFLEENGLLV